MLRAVSGFSNARKNGLFINSCFAHCQTERQDTWFADDSPVINKKVSISCAFLPCEVMRLSLYSDVIFFFENEVRRWQQRLEIGILIEHK